MNPPSIFQAIGLIEGEVIENEGKFTVALGSKKYPLFYKEQKRRILLQNRLSQAGTNTGLVVYPMLSYFPEDKLPYRLGFQFLHFAKASSHGADRELNVGEFKLAGLWQFLPVCRTPVVSIHRNSTPSLLKYLATASLTAKVRSLKSVHVPLLWRDPPVPPFRFNPKLSKDEQLKPYFVQVKANFNSSRSLFQFVSLMSIPTWEPPPFLKATREDKVQARELKLTS